MSIITLNIKNRELKEDYIISKFSKYLKNTIDFNKDFGKLYIS